MSFASPVDPPHKPRSGDISIARSVSVGLTCERKGRAPKGRHPRAETPQCAAPSGLVIELDGGVVPRRHHPGLTPGAIEVPPLRGCGVCVLMVVLIVASFPHLALAQWSAAP